MTALFLSFLTVSLAVSVLLALLLAFRHRLERRYAAQTRWMVWLGVAAVLLLAPLLPRTLAPVKVEVPAHTVSLSRPAPAAVQPMENVVQAGLEAVEPVQAPAPVVSELQGKPQTVSPAATAPVSRPVRSLDWTQLAAGLWLTVAAALLVGQVGRYLLSRRRLLGRSYPLAKRVALPGDKAEIRVLPGLATPITLGFFRRVILLPSEGTDPMAVRHELTHLERRDVWGKGILFLACALHWFNPLVWLMARQADRDVEAACDAQAVAGMSAGEKRAYGDLLLSAADGGGSIPFATYFGGSKEQMKTRLTQIFRPGKRSKGLVCVLLASALLLSGLVACQGKAEKESGLADGTYCSPAGDVFYPVGEADAEGEDYGSIRLSLLAYDETEGPHGEHLGEYTLPLSAELTLRRSEGAEEKSAGEKGTEEWEQTVRSCIMWPILRSMYVPDMDDYLTVEVENGQVVHMAWVQVPDSTCYVNTTNGFTLALPDSWAGKYEVEDSGTIITFYQKEADRAAGHLMDLVITPRNDFRELYGDKDLEGMYDSGGPWIKVLYEGDNVIYAQIDPASFPEAPKDEAEEERLSLLRNATAALGPEDFALYGGGTLVENAGKDLWLELVYGEHTEMERLRNLALDPALEIDQPQWFTRKELEAAGYQVGAEALKMEESLKEAGYQIGDDTPVMAFYEVKNAPASMEEFLNQLYNQFAPELAESICNCARWSDALCFFTEGKMWHREGYEPVWYEYDWDTFRVLDSGEDFVEYSLEGYSNDGADDIPVRKTWQFTLRREDVGGGAELWRYADTGTEVSNAAQTAMTWEDWCVHHTTREHHHPVSTRVLIDNGSLYIAAPDGGEPLVFVNSMGCTDHDCTDPSHYHYCGADCTDPSHYHDCPEGCSDTEHHHGDIYHTNTVVTPQYVPTHHPEEHHSEHHG